MCATSTGKTDLSLKKSDADKLSLSASDFLGALIARWDRAYFEGSAFAAMLFISLLFRRAAFLRWITPF